MVADTKGQVAVKNEFQHRIEFTLRHFRSYFFVSVSQFSAIDQVNCSLMSLFSLS